MTIRKQWRIGESCQFKGDDSIYKVNKIIKDRFTGEDILTIIEINNKKSFQLMHDFNLIKISDKERNNTQIRLNILMFILNL